MNELALFAGAGGGILGGHLLGWNTVCAVEIERYPREVLLQRQRDGVLPRFPIWDDVCTFDGKPWRGLVDVVSGGFPCQDISSAGKGAGIDGARSGLWSEMHRVICEVRPRYAFMENSPMLTSRGLGRVLGDLAASGYDAAWMVLGAADVGAPHQRDRIWILAEDEAQRVAEHAHLHHERTQPEVSGRAADTEGVCEAMGEHPSSPDTHAHGVQCPEQGGEHEGAEEFAGGCTNGVEAGGDVAYSDSIGRHERTIRDYGERKGAFMASDRRGEEERTRALFNASCLGREAKSVETGDSCQTLEEEAREQFSGANGRQVSPWRTEPDVGRVADGVADRVDRLKAIGNGQVPLVAATAFRILKHELNKHLNNETRRH